MADNTVILSECLKTEKLGEGRTKLLEVYCAVIETSNIALF